MQLEKISRIAQHTAKTIIRIEDVKYKLMKTEQITRQIGKTREIKVSWVTRRAVMKLTYFSGFTTAIYRSGTRLHRFIIEAYAKSHLVNSTQDAQGRGQLQPPLM